MLTFAAMQTFRDELATEGKMTILGGFVGSWLFVLLLTVGTRIYRVVVVGLQIEESTCSLQMRGVNIVL